MYVCKVKISQIFMSHYRVIWLCNGKTLSQHITPGLASSFCENPTSECLDLCGLNTDKTLLHVDLHACDLLMAVCVCEYLGVHSHTQEA